MNIPNRLKLVHLSNGAIGFEPWPYVGRSYLIAINLPFYRSFCSFVRIASVADRRRLVQKQITAPCGPAPAHLAGAFCGLVLFLAALVLYFVCTDTPLALRAADWRKWLTTWVFAGVTSNYCGVRLFSIIFYSWTLPSSFNFELSCFVSWLLPCGPSRTSADFMASLLAKMRAFHNEHVAPGVLWGSFPSCLLRTTFQTNVTRVVD